MRDDYISWEELIKKWGLLDGEFRKKFILTGLLQPYDDAVDPIQPPGVKEIQRELYSVDVEFQRACSTYYRQRGRQFDQWNLDKDDPYDQTMLAVLRKFQNYVKQKEDELAKYPLLPTWCNFAWPVNDDEADRVRKILKASYFKLEDVLEIEYRRGEGKTDEAIAVSHTQDENTVMDHEEFVRSLKFIYLDGTEIKIINRGKPTTCSYDTLGFKTSKTQEWTTLCEILETSDHAYRLGPAHYIDKETRQKVASKDYRKKLQLLKAINKKLISFLANHYGVKFPLKYKLYERKPSAGPGVYNFKFNIPSDKPSYKKIDQALSRLEMLVRDNASTENILLAAEIAMDAGANPDKVAELTAAHVFPTTAEYHQTTADHYDDGCED